MTMPRFKYESLITDRLFSDHDDLTSLAGVDRSQVSRILRLRLLSPRIQEYLLNLPESQRDPITLEQIKPILLIPAWDEQERVLSQLVDVSID